MKRQYIWFSAIFIVVVLVGIIALYFSFRIRNDPENCEEACSSKQCLDAVTSIAENMDKQIDPCQNFYYFTCGSWINKNGNNSYQITMKDKMKKELLVRIKDILDKVDEKNTSTTTGKLKIVYDSCMNESTSDSSAIPSVLQFFRRLGLRDWPNLSNNFEFSRPSLEEVIATLIEFDMFPFIKFDASTDKDENGLRLFVVTGKEHFSVDFAENLMPQVLNHFNVRTQNIDNIVSDYVSLSKEVMSSLPKEFCIEDCEYQAVPVDCTSMPKRQMKFICNIAQYLIKHNHLESNISRDNLVLLNTSPVLVLYNLVSYYSHRTLANYFASSFLSKSIPHLHFLHRDLKFNFLDDQKEDSRLPEEKWEFCTLWMSTLMPQHLGLLYARHRFTMPELEEVDDITEFVINGAADLILKQEWMEEKERKEISDTVRQMKNSLVFWFGYLLDDTFSGLMEGYKPTNTSFLWNALEYQKRGFIFDLFNALPETQQRIAKIFEAGAQYTPGNIDLLFGILLPPVYDYFRPWWMNYISLGTVVAHEIGHEIIHNLQTRELSNMTLERMSSKAHCLRQQYSSFTLEHVEKKVDGDITLDENLADLISIQLTEKVMNKIMMENKGEEYICLPDILLSTRQIFYMLSSQMWCETESSDIDYEKEHTLARFRITGAIQNAKEFSDVFKCSKSSYMNPVSKCVFFE